MIREFAQKQYEGSNGWTVWAVVGRIDSVTADAALAFGKDVVGNNAKTVLDMTELDYISSAGLRVLLIIQKQAAKEGKEFIIAGASGMVSSVLEDSGLSTLFTMRDSMDGLK